MLKKVKSPLVRSRHKITSTKYPFCGLHSFAVILICGSGTFCGVSRTSNFGFKIMTQKNPILESRLLTMSEAPRERFLHTSVNLEPIYSCHQLFRHINAGFQELVLIQNTPKTHKIVILSILMIFVSINLSNSGEKNLFSLSQH